MWGARFSVGSDELMKKINTSVHFDKIMYNQDITASIAHARMLSAQKIITKADMLAITSGLIKIQAQIKAGKFKFNEDLEDIHMNIESALKSKIGTAAGRLHTARSRNDQVATDFKLWLRDSIDTIIEDLSSLTDSLITKAKANANTLSVGYTHLQVAQPITFGHHLLAYSEMFIRDISRFKDCRARLNECPLGACALSGTGFNIDRHMTARELGFDKPTDNSMDSVASRDFALEFLSNCAISSINLSRLGEEIVLWLSKGFDFISLSDKFTTGSSIMPQKKNPDAAELIRAKPGRIIGSLNALLIVMKALPLTYSKDMQEDKQPCFDASDSLLLSINCARGLVVDLKPNKKAMLQALEGGYPTATDLADYLTAKHKIPFRKSHALAGKIVSLAQSCGVALSELSLEQMRQIVPKLSTDVYEVLSVVSSVNSKLSYGGTAPKQVLKACALTREKLQKLKKQTGKKKARK